MSASRRKASSRAKSRAQAKSSVSRFLDKIISELELLTRFAEPKNRKVLEARLMQTFLPADQAGITREPIWQMSRRQEYLATVFEQYKEIASAVSGLELSATFLSRTRAASSTAEMISYHIEKHLEQPYIARERMTAFLTRIARQLRKRGMTAEAEKLEQLGVEVRTAFDDLTKTRGVHVHERRFEDDSVRRAETLDMFVKKGGMKQLEALRRLHMQRALNKWRMTTADNARKSGTLFDRITDAVSDLIFKNLAPPPRGKGVRGSETSTPKT